MSTGSGTPAEDDSSRLLVLKGDASPEEVAALVVVLHATAAQVAAAPARKPTREWSAHHRKARVTFPAGPEGWRSSGLPR